MTVHIDLDRLAGVVFVKFLHCQVPLFFPCSILSSLEGSHCGHVSGLGSCTPSFRGSIYINFLEFFCMGDLSLLHLLTYSIIYLYQYGLVGIYFIL